MWLVDARICDVLDWLGYTQGAPVVRKLQSSLMMFPPVVRPSIEMFCDLSREIALEERD